jgi:hypothetical protein
MLTGLITSLRSLPYHFIMVRKFGANQARESGVEKKKFGVKGEARLWEQPPLVKSPNRPDVFILSP